MATQRPYKQGEKSKRDNNKEIPESQPFERQIVRKNIVKSVVGILVVSVVLYLYVPIPVPSLPTTSHRLLYTLRLQTPAFLILFAAILNVGTIRLATPAIDPIHGNSEHLVEFAVRFLTNHVEQTLLNIPGQLVLASFLAEEQMKIIPILVMLFVFGRVSFYYGYKQSYLKRTVGFMTSMGPSIFIWLVNAYFVGRALIQNDPIKL